MPSATAEDAPKAKSSSVVTTIRRMVFFMFFSCGELGSLHGQKHSPCLPPAEDKIGIFQSSKITECLWAEQLSDTLVCQTGRQISWDAVYLSG